MTTTQQPTAGKKNAWQKAKETMVVFKAEDPGRFRSFQLNCALTIMSGLAGYVMVTRPVGWVFLLSAGLMALVATNDVQAWRIGQLKKRLDALDAPPRGPAPATQENVAPGPINAS